MFDPNNKEDLLLLRESLVYGRAFENQHDALICSYGFCY